MKIFIEELDDGFLILARAEGGGLEGDLEFVVREGESFFDVSYQEIARHGPGEMEIK